MCGRWIAMVHVDSNLQVPFCCRCRDATYRPLNELLADKGILPPRPAPATGVPW